MSENTLYIVPIDRDYQPTAEQKDNAFSYFEKIVTEAENEPCIYENASFTDDDGQKVVTKVALTAGWVFGNEECWQLDGEEYEDVSEEDEEYYEIMYGTQLTSDAQQKLEELFGTKLEVIWVRD